MAAQDSQSLSEQVCVERYRFVLDEIKELNRNVHRYITLFQTVSTALVSGGVIVFASWKKLEVGAELALAALRGILWLLALSATFSVLCLLAGIFSWLRACPITPTG